jgi:hypothetical protein
MVESNLYRNKKASVALDIFHASCPVDNLEDFEFYVFDPRTGLILSEDAEHETYSSAHLGRDLERVSNQTPYCYQVIIDAVSGDAALSRVGTIQIAAYSIEDAQRSASASLWGSHLDEGGYKAHFITNRSGVSSCEHLADTTCAF